MTSKNKTNTDPVTTSTKQSIIPFDWYPKMYITFQLNEPKKKNNCQKLA